MVFRAITRYVRISPRKARLAAALIRGKAIPEARLQLLHCGLKGGRLLIKTLESAVSNAESQSEARAEQLTVREVRIDEGPRLKRVKPCSKGRRHAYVHKTSHFTIVVAAE